MQVARTQDRSDSLSNRIAIGESRLAIRRGGSGGPTVVLETGLGAEAAEWAPVQRQLQAGTTVCSYDRLGRGASDKPATPRTAADMADELRRLLEEADLPAPFLVVGHSFGGLLARVFARRYPADVCGIVLVDSMHENQFDLFGPLFPEPRPDEPPALAQTRTFWREGWRDPRSTPELIDLVASLQQARDVRTLGSIPLHVMTAGTCLHQPFVPDDLRPRMQQCWEGLQESFLLLSTVASQSFHRHCGHFIQREDPDAIVDVVKSMLAVPGRSEDQGRLSPPG